MLLSFPTNGVEDFWEYSAVEAPLTDTLASAQLYLGPSSQNPFLLNSHTKFVFSHSLKWPTPVTDTLSHPKGIRL